MLQFSVIPSPNMTVADQTVMAINAGCKWIETDPALINEDELAHIINKCKEAEIILTFRHSDVLLDRHRVHGVHLAPADTEPKTIREKLGGHPIIGIDATPYCDLKTMRRDDVDYLVINGFPGEEAMKSLLLLCKKISETGIDFPVVAEGIITADEFENVTAAGANGINIDLRSLQGPEYECSLKAYIEKTAL